MSKGGKKLDKRNYHKSKNNSHKNIYSSDTSTLLRKSMEENIVLKEELAKQKQQIQNLLKEASSYKKDLDKYTELNKSLQESNAMLTVKAQKYDDIEIKLSHIRLKAESEAISLLESAQSNALDAIYVIDDIEDNVKLFEKDIELLKKDLKIGSLTVEDRINIFHYAILSYIDDLKVIKKKFYSKYKLPINTDTYEYISVAQLMAHKEYSNKVANNK